MARMAPYGYQPLGTDGSAIRLISLLPGKWEEEVSIEIETVKLEMDTWPQYEALSYTWGAVEDPVPLRIGALTNQIINITQNLATALPYLRLPDRPRVLWIDAISIDQNNLIERSRQVRKMGDIFQKADKVIVWLGPEQDQSMLALSQMDFLASKIAIDWQSQTMQPVSTEHSEAHWADKNVALPYDWTTWNAMYCLLTRSWFERLWIWQEIRLRTREADLLCGTHNISWQQFRKAIFCLTVKAEVPDIGVGLHERVRHIFGLCNTNASARLEALISQTRYCRCSDPRDRIFAILGLVDKTEADIHIEPDYTHSVGKVYKDVAVEYIQKRKSLEILRYCGMRDKKSGLTKWIPKWAVPTELQDWQMPSWVPDWSLPTAGMDLPNVYATGTTFAEPNCDGSETLEVIGVALGTVTNLEPILPAEATRNIEETLGVMEKLAPTYFEDHEYIAGGSLADAFLRTVCCNRFDDNYLPPLSVLPNFQHAKEAFIVHIAGKDSLLPMPPALKIYLAYIDGHIVSRSLLRLKEGYIGLAPDETQVGDQVYLIVGSGAPIILRPKTNEEWQVVGRCYVHGVEDGRVFLGDLPERYRHVLRLEKGSGGYLPAYLDQQTNEILIEDPRLGPLPPGWRVKRHKHMNAWNGNTAEGSGEDGNTPQKLLGDPRWKVDALKRRGVKLQTIKLV